MLDMFSDLDQLVHSGWCWFALQIFQLNIWLESCWQLFVYLPFKCTELFLGPCQPKILDSRSTKIWSRASFRFYSYRRVWIAMRTVRRFQPNLFYFHAVSAKKLINNWLAHLFLGLAQPLWEFLDLPLNPLRPHTLFSKGIQLYICTTNISFTVHK